MNIENLLHLKAFCFEKQDNKTQKEIHDLEVFLDTKLPLDLCEILSYFKGSIMFEDGAKFKPKENPYPNIEDKENYQCLEIIYGLGLNKTSIVEAHTTYKDQISSNFIIIGDCSGGNPVCQDSRNGYIYYWNHEKDFSEGLYLINNSLSGFISILEPDTNRIDISNKIDESNSWLDF